MFDANPYSAYGYSFPQNSLRPTLMSNPQPTQPQMQQTTLPALIQVADMKQVEQITVQPGTRTIVLVQNEPILAMRAADQMGLVQTDYYRLEKMDASGSESEYVTRAEFDAFVNRLLGNNEKKEEMK